MLGLMRLRDCSYRSRGSMSTQPSSFTSEGRSSTLGVYVCVYINIYSVVCVGAHIYYSVCMCESAYIYIYMYIYTVYIYRLCVCVCVYMCLCI